MKTKHVLVMLAALTIFLETLGLYSLRDRRALLSVVPEVTVWTDNKGNSGAWYTCGMTVDGFRTELFNARADGMCYAADAPPYPKNRIKAVTMTDFRWRMK